VRVELLARAGVHGQDYIEAGAIQRFRSILW
jgi:hypothetical protein